LDSSWSTLNKSGELIGLKDEDGIMTEEFTYKQIENYSLERKDVEELIIDEDNWQEHLDSNSVGQENYWKVDDTNTDDTEDNGGTEDDDADDTENTEGEEEDDNDEDSEEENTGGVTTSTLVINEFVSNPNDEENEWAEIYNNSTTSIDLTGWTMSDGVGVFASPTGTVQAEDLPIIKIVDKLLELSYLNKASDIHIEPFEKRTVIRFRIDGLLHDIVVIPIALHDLIVTRIKNNGKT